KYFVREPSSESQIWWENNQAIEPVKFDVVLESMLAYARDKDLYVQDLFGGADATHRLGVRVITELAWHSLFIQHMLIEPTLLERRHFRPEFTIVCLPGFSADPVTHGCRSSTIIAIHLAK